MDTSFPSNKKRNYHDDTTFLPTAEKSQHRLHTEEYLERTPVRSNNQYGDRVSEARRSINQVLELVNQKKQMNEEAIGEVRHVNHQILNSLTAFNPSKHNPYDQRHRTAEQVRREDSRDYVATSQFQWRPAAPPAHPEEQLKRSIRDGNVSQQNIELRARLNEELKKNNDLLKYVTKLQSQNSTLRNSVRSTTQPDVQNLLEQNRYLRSQLTNASNNGSNIAPYNLIQELQRLKQQNSSLRKDTLSLLKSSKY